MNGRRNATSRYVNGTQVWVSAGTETYHYHNCAIDGVIFALYKRSVKRSK
jgi:hypothetical protein